MSWLLNREVAGLTRCRWVATDMGNKGAKSAGMEQAPVKVEDSVAGLLEKVDGATREKTSGTFQSYDDMKFNW